MHSISNKMIGMDQSGFTNSLNHSGIPDRRRRTPSKYAQSIRQLAQITGKQKKEKPSSSNEEQSDHVNAQCTSSTSLLCILPNINKKLRLSVIIKKPEKPKQKSLKLVKVHSEKEKDKGKDLLKGKSLLDTLLAACKEADVVEEDRKYQGQNGKQEGGDHTDLIRNQSRTKKEREEEEKYSKLYERYKSLSQRLENQTNIVLI